MNHKNYLLLSLLLCGCQTSFTAGTPSGDAGKTNFLIKSITTPPPIVKPKRMVSMVMSTPVMPLVEMQQSVASTPIDMPPVTQSTPDTSNTMPMANSVVSPTTQDMNPQPIMPIISTPTMPMAMPPVMSNMATNNAPMPQEITIMNGTHQKITIYSINAMHQETILASEVGPIAKIIIPQGTTDLKVTVKKTNDIEELMDVQDSMNDMRDANKASTGNETFEATIQLQDFSILGIQHKMNMDDIHHSIEILPIKQEIQRGVVVYNTTHEHQLIKISYPDEITFFFTPKVYYSVPPFSAEFFTLPCMNKKHKRTRIHVSIQNGTKHLINKDNEESLFVIHGTEDDVFMDNVTEDFQD